MSVTVEINQLTNNSSKLGIFINDRPVYWTCRALVKKDDAIDHNSDHYMRYVVGLSLLSNLINKYTDLNVPKNDSNRDAYKNTLKEGEKALSKRFGNDGDFDKLMQLCKLTEEISDNMLNYRYSVDGPEPLRG